MQKGFYHKQILELFKWFPKQNIKIIIMEKMIVDEENTYDELFDFLDVDRQKITISKERVGNYEEKKISDDMYNKLKKIYQDDVGRLEKLLNCKKK